MSCKRILVAPLNWGLGHATRCVPIIHALQKQEWEVIIASDGLALAYLQKEFPKIQSYELAALNIRYARNKYWQTSNMLRQIPRLVRFMAKDTFALHEICKKIKIDGIISDCRPSIYKKGIPSVYVNHQLNVKFGVFSFLSSYFHQQLMKKYDEIWVPDVKEEPSLSGELGHVKQSKSLQNIQYIGWISRLSYVPTTPRYDYCAVLSGPEPQRSIFQEKIEQLFERLPGNKICITGKAGEEKLKNKVMYKGLLHTDELSRILLASKVVICRSGYTSLLDLIKLQKTALLVPTPGQFEQEYLGKKMQQLGWFSVCSQAELLQKGRFYLQTLKTTPLPSSISIQLDFSVFEKQDIKSLKIKQS